MAKNKVGIWNRALINIGVSNLVESDSEDRAEVKILNAVYDDLLEEVLQERHWPWALYEKPLTEVSSQSISYSGDGSQTEFVIPYGFADSQDITVEVDDVEQTLGTDYTVTEASGGVDATVTMTSAPSGSETLKITVTTTRVGWDYIYSLPSDFLKPVGILYSDLHFESLSREAKIPFEIMLNNSKDGKILCCNLPDGDVDALQYVPRIDYVPMMPAHFIEALAWRIAETLALGLKKSRTLARECRQNYLMALSGATATAENDRQPVREPPTPSILARQG